MTCCCPREPGPGDGVRFRAAGPDDAATVLALKHSLDRETSFMLFEPGERAETAADVAAELRRVADAANSVVIVAETAAGLAGYVDARGAGSSAAGWPRTW